uniref:MMS19 nucleotide excision repair protein n=1 Tax=Electrophorus electricus TaxID=8005 RepID=A0A4W4E528_ELEEL
MAADSIRLLDLVGDFVTGQVDSKATDVANGCVADFRLSLTSSESQTRGRGVQLLSQVLEECYTSLSEREVEVLVAFYENRLKDHYAITPHVLHGLKALAKCTVLPKGSAVSILKSLFQDVHVQSHGLANEFDCIPNHAELKGLGPDFVFGFVQAVDGERDPRNLLLAFQIARNIIHRGYNLSQFTEELFEVTSCYFPIDFTPVCRILTSFPSFLLPLIIEKLDSDMQNAKVDSLQTLAACASVYGHKELSDFLPSLWSSIRREVFQTASESVESAGLSALRALTSCLCRSVLTSNSEDSLHVFLDLVLKDCQHHLCEPDLKLVWPSAKLLQAASGASYRASLIVTAVVLPTLLEQYSSRTQCAQRRTLLEVVQGFIQPTASSWPAEGEETVLQPFRKSLCSVVFSALAESNASLQITAAKVLTKLGQQPGVLAQPDVEMAVDHLSRLVLEEHDAKVSLAVAECAGSLSRLHPAPFASRMIPKLKQEIFSGSSKPNVSYRCIMALASVSTQPSLVRESAPVLLQMLAAAHTGMSCCRIFSVEEVVSVCCSLQRIADQTPNTEEMGHFFHDVVIPRLLTLSLHAALQGENESGHSSPLIEEAVLSAIVPVINTACAALQTELATTMAAQAVYLFLDGDVSFLPENDCPSKIQLLRSQSWTQSQLVCLLMACVCSLPHSVDIPEFDRLLGQLEELSCTSTHPFSYTSAAKCFAGLINKRAAGQTLDGVLEKTLRRISVTLDNQSSAQRIQAFNLLVWMTKALLLRYHPLSAVLTDKVFSLMSDCLLASQAADCFELLMSDSPDVLNRSCHADVRIMYRQRFFAENSGKIVQGFNCAEQGKKSVYLKALSHIVNNLPRQVQLTELPSLLPVLLEALSCPDQVVQLSTLCCLQPALLDPPPALSTQLEALFSRLLPLTASPSMKVRIASLRCVHALSQLPEHMVLPFRAQVLRALASPLDDKKRLVRKEAVLARGEWWVFGNTLTATTM